MGIDEIYSIVKYVVNKNQQGYVNPAQFNLLFNKAQVEFLDYLLGEFQQYQYGRSQPRVSYGQNSSIRNRLTPLIYGYILNPDPSGFAPYMGDYQQVDTMWTIYGYNRIRYVQQDSLYSYYNSVIDPIETNPIYLLKEKGFQFFPTTIIQAKVEYVRTPPAVKWAYTEDANKRPLYDAVNSIDPIWYDTDIFDILSRVFRMIGVSLQANDVSAYANEIKTNGQ